MEAETSGDGFEMEVDDDISDDDDDGSKWVAVGGDVDRDEEKDEDANEEEGVRSDPGWRVREEVGTELEMSGRLEVVWSRDSRPNITGDEEAVRRRESSTVAREKAESE